jgi:hypothetical protein
MTEVDEYLGEQALEVAAAPPRNAYVIRQGDRAAFESAVREASSRWAGVTEPIIPMRKNGKIDPGWLELLDISRIETLVNVGCDESVTESLAKNRDLNHVPYSQIEFAPHPQAMHWSAVARNLQPTAAREDAPLWEMVAAGSPNEPTDAPSLAPVLRFGTEDIAGRAAIQGETVLDAGLAGFSEYVKMNRIVSPPALIWLTPPNHLPACLWFWNMRALRSLAGRVAPMILLPTSYKSWVGLPVLINSCLSRQYHGDVDVVVEGHGRAHSQISDLIEYLKFEPHASDNFNYDAGGWSPDKRTPPFKYLEGFDPRKWLSFKRRAGYHTTKRVQRFRARTTVSLAIPSLQTAIPEGASFPLYYRLSGGFLSEIPRTKLTAGLIHQDARWRDVELELAAPIPRSEISVSSPSPSQVLNALKQGIGALTYDSDKGRLASAIHEARSGAVLLEPDALSLIGKLRTPRSRDVMKQLRQLASDTPTRKLEEIASSLGNRSGRKFSSAAPLGGRQALAGLEKLVGDGWAERGLELKCQRCGVSSFVPLHEVTNAANCPGCSASGTYSAAKGLDVMYRLDTLVDRASDQGALPHLAALMTLQQRSHETHLSMGLQIDWPDGTSQEADLFGFMGSRIISGEVKTSASEFDAEQIIRDVELSRRLKADVHVMAATQEIPRTAIRFVIERCAAASLQPMILMPAEGSGMTMIGIPPANRG